MSPAPVVTPQIIHTHAMEGASRSPPPAVSSLGEFEHEFPSSGTMLHVDDIGVNRQLFELNVRRFFGKGWALISAETAEAAVQAADCESFDLILMDELFPGAMQGSDAIREIREREASRGVAGAVIVSCTGHADNEARVAAIKEAGADAVWGKPMPSAADGTIQRQIASLIAERRRRFLRLRPPVTIGRAGSPLTLGAERSPSASERTSSLTCTVMSTNACKVAEAAITSSPRSCASRAALCRLR